MPRTVLEIAGQDVGASKAITDVTGAVAKAALALEGMNAVSSVMIGLATKSVAAYGESEQAIAKLRVQVGNNTSAFEAFASAIQSSTVIDDEQVLALQSLGMNMGILDDNINEATKQAIGLSEAFGIDLNSAMKMVAQANEGQYTMLSRYIPALRTATTDSQKLAIMQEAAAKGFEMAGEKANTLTGQLAVNKNLMGDLQEELGKTILQLTEPFVGALNEVTKWFLSLDDGTKEFITTVGVVAGVSVTSAVAITGIATAIKAVTVAMAGNPFGLMLIGVTAVVTAVVSLVGWLNRTKESIDKLSSDDLTKKLKEDEEAFKKLAEKTGVASTKLDELAAAKIRFNKIPIEGGDVEKYQAVEQQEKLAKEIMDIRKKLESDKKKQANSAGAEINEVYEQWHDKYLDLVQNNYDKIERERKKDLEKVKGNKKAELEVNKYYDEMIKDDIVESYNKAYDAVSTATNSIQGVIDQYYTNEITAAEGNSERIKELKREQFNANKTVSTINSIINTAEAVTKALAGSPPPINFIMAGLVGGLGAVQTGLIAAQPMPAFEKGGIVPGNSYSGDNVMIRANSGELVLTVAEQRALLNAQSGIHIHGDVHLYSDNVNDMAKQLRSLKRAEASRA